MRSSAASSRRGRTMHLHDHGQRSAASMTTYVNHIPFPKCIMTHPMIQLRAYIGELLAFTEKIKVNICVFVVDIELT